MASNALNAVYAAVTAGESAERVRQVIEQCPPEQRVAAINHEDEEAAETPLKAAIRLGRGDLVGALVEAGADVEEALGDAATPLAVCAFYGQVDSLRALLRAGHDPDERVFCLPYYNGWRRSEQHYCTAVHLCFSPGVWYGPQEEEEPAPPPPHLDCLEALVREGGADVNARDSRRRTLFHLAADLAESDAAAAVDLLIQLGADVNAGCDDPAGNATSGCPPPLVRFIYGWGRFEKVHVDCLRKLVAAGARTSGVFNIEGWSPLAEAVLGWHDDAVRFLLHEAGAPVDERNPNTGATPLIAVFAHEDADDVDTECLGILLDAGADVNAADRQGRTALMHAVSLNRFEAAWLLLERGASADSVDSTSGLTPLMLACQKVRDTHEPGGGYDGLILDGDDVWALIEELARRSSVATRRAVSSEYGGSSAIDLLDIPPWTIWQEAGNEEEGEEDADEGSDWTHRQKNLIADLLASGVPVLPRNTPYVMSLGLARGSLGATAAEAELAARRSEARRWCAHDDVVGLALEGVELREAEERVRAAERRVWELEAEVGEPGPGDEGESESGALPTTTEDSE